MVWEKLTGQNPSNFNYVLTFHITLKCWEGKEQRSKSWLRHCTTSRKVVDSIPVGVNGIFHWHNPAGRTMALGSTNPLTEMSTGNIS